MFGQKPFVAIRYKKPKSESDDTEIPGFVGLDSEAYSDGAPFMFCTSLKDVFLPSDLPLCFFDPKFSRLNFVLFNMKYDAGAIFRCILTKPEMKQLARYQETTTKAGVRITYLPHKHIAMTYNKIHRDFWDIAQYYHSSLEKASRKYLKVGKAKVETKSFSRAYVKRHWKHLAYYCIKDASLTARLADYFKVKLKEFGVIVSSLYSPASLAFNFFTERIGKVIDVYDVWTENPLALMFAHESYQGGKFECTRRGSFTGYEYDIVSAYPWQMRNLIDITNAFWCRSTKFPDGAYYSWLHVKIHHHNPEIPPCNGLLIDGVRVYCQGTYTTYITSAEYVYLTENGIGVQILDGWHCIPTRIRYPYRETIDYLFSVKDKYKGKDAMLYSITKLMMNSYYGRMANLNERHEPPDPDCTLTQDKYGEVTLLDAGTAWNPFYASMITANTRIYICKLQKLLGHDALAVHTDSVICTKKLPSDMLSSVLGGLELKLTGSGLLVMSGLYDFEGHTACRGIEMGKGFSWTRLLLTKPRGWRYRYPQTRAISWTQATAWDRTEDINLFESAPKWIDINADVKRDWGKRIVKGHHLLHGLIDSAMIEINPK